MNLTLALWVCILVLPICSKSSIAESTQAAVPPGTTQQTDGPPAPTITPMGFSTTALRVSIIGTNIPDNIEYRAIVEGKPDVKCEKEAAVIHSCLIDHLKPGEKCTGTIQACVIKSNPYECSDVGPFEGWAKPIRPVSVRVEPITTTAVAVRITPSTDASIIDSYEISLNGSKPERCAPQSLEKPVCEVAGLEAETKYKAAVKSCISEAPDEFCGEVTLGSGWTRPNKPESVKVVAESTTSLTVTFEAPTVSTNIGLYEVHREGDDTGPKCSITPKPGDELKCAVGELNVGTEYVFTVKSCITEANPVVCSENAKASGYTKPNDPASVTVEPETSSSVVVVVQSPTAAQGIVRYQASVEGVDAAQACEIMDTSSPRCTIGGLQAATKYTVRVVSCAGSSSSLVCGEGITGSGWTRPIEPKSVKVVAQSTTSLAVTFEEPQVCTNICRYEVYEDGDDSQPKCLIGSGSELKCLLTDLAVATEYKFNVRACINDTNPAVCSEDVMTSGWTKPNEPKSVKVVAQSTTSLTVTFEEPPVCTNIGRYEVYEDGDDSQPKCLIGSGPELKCSLTDLAVATEYKFNVRACINDTNPAVCSENVMTSGWTKPNAPSEIVIGTISSRSIYVTFSKPEAGDNNIQFYEALANLMVRKVMEVNSPKCSVPASATNLGCTIENLNPDADYTISVRSCIKANVCGDEVGLIKITTCPDSPNYVLIISLLVVFFVIIIVIILAVVFIKRRQSRRSAVDEEQSDSISDLETVIETKE